MRFISEDGSVLAVCRLPVPGRDGAGFLPGRETYATEAADGNRWRVGYASRSIIPDDGLAQKENNAITVSLMEESNNDPVISDLIEIVRRCGTKGIGLAPLGLEIRRRHRNFNVKLYGYSQLYKFIDSMPELEVKGGNANRKVTLKKN